MVECTARSGIQRVAGGARTDPHKRKRRTNRVRIAIPTIASMIAVLGATVFPVPKSAGASSPADQGVTSTSIRIGVPVIDFAALESVGVTLNDGNFQDAFNALTAHINAQGGVDGRKVVPYFVETNPAVTASGNSSCCLLYTSDAADE